jgi:hypothetical protein
MELPVTLQQRIIAFLSQLPNINTTSSREALLLSAGLDFDLHGQIDCSGPSGPFFPRLLATLWQYGVLQDDRYALEAVLDAAQQMVGQDRRAICAALLAEIGAARRQSANPSQAQQPKTAATMPRPAELRDRIAQSFNLTELRDVCYDLDVNFEDLGGEGLKAKARELVQFMERRQRLPELLNALKAQRPETFGNF